MNQPNLFDDEPDLAIRISHGMADMHRVYGRDDAHTCGACIQFEHLRSGNSTFAKCRLAHRSASRATDWAAKWPACGKFIPGSQHD
jgi:hypothetical protein